MQYRGPYLSTTFRQYANPHPNLQRNPDPNPDSYTVFYTRVESRNPVAGRNHVENVGFNLTKVLIPCY